MNQPPKVFLVKEPFDHQFEGFHYAWNHHYSINAFSMGLGKTLVAIMLQEATQFKTLIVCPAYLKPNWKNEFGKMSEFPPEVKVLNTKSMKDLSKGNLSNYDVIVINYEMLKHAGFLFDWAELVIADECQYLKNPDAARTQYFVDHTIKYRPSRFLGLSGTPVERNIGEWFVHVYLCSLNPHGTSGTDITKLFKNQWAWNLRFSNQVKMKMGDREFTKFEGERNLPEFWNLMKNKYIRKKTEECIDLPEFVNKEVFVDYSHDDRSLYDMWVTYETGAKKEVDEHMMTTKSESALAKAPFTSKYVADLVDQGLGPIVVFTDHRRSLDKIVEDLQKKKLRVCKVNGSTSPEKRAQYVEEFQDGKYDVFAATIKAACTGITLVRSRHMVFNDEYWLKTVNDQARDRIRRIGQENEGVYHYILGSHVDELIHRGIARQEGVLEKIIEFKE